MFLAGAIMRFGRAVLIFAILVLFIWLILRGISFAVRLLYDQIEDESSDWKVWLKSKLPERKKKQKRFDISRMSNEDLHELAQMIAKIEDDVDLD